MEEQSYQEALDTFRMLGQHDRTLLPFVWQGRALKRLDRLHEATEVLRDGLRLCSAGEDPFRRAVALWNLACYRALQNPGNHEPEFVRSVVDILKEAIQNAPEFRESLSAKSFDRDLATLLWRPTLRAVACFNLYIHCSQER